MSTHDKFSCGLGGLRAEFGAERGQKEKEEIWKGKKGTIEGELTACSLSSTPEKQEL